MALRLRIDELFPAMAARIETVRLQTILGAAGRVYLADEDPPEQEEEPSLPWGRVVFLTRETLWPQRDVPGEAKNVAWLMSVQFNDFKAPGYRVGIGIGAAHEEIFARLDNFAPALPSAQIVVPVWRYGAPPAAPFYDADRRLWITNAEYRAQVGPVDIP